MQTPSLMSHLDHLAGVFNSLSEDLTEAQSDSDALASKLRDHCSEAGHLLIDMLRDGSLSDPEPPSIGVGSEDQISWLALCTKRDAVRFRSIELLGFPSDMEGIRPIQLGPPSRHRDYTPGEDLEFVAVHVSMVSWFERDQKALGTSGKNGESCLKRFAFIEAACTWLRSRYYPHVTELELPRCVLQTEDGRDATLPFDHFTSGDIREDEKWRQLATLCAYACRALVELQRRDQATSCLLAGSDHQVQSHGRVLQDPKWSQPNSLKHWGRVFQKSPTTIRRWIRDNKIRAQPLSRQSYRIAVEHLPPSGRE